MSRVSSLSLGLVVLLASVAAVRGQDAKTPRTDLCGDPLPPGVVARLGTIRLRDGAAAVTVSQDGKRLISFTSCNDEIRVWDTVSGKVVRRKRLIGVPQKFQWFMALDVSPDGDTAAVWDARMLYLYDTTTGKQRTQLLANEYSPLLEFSPDGKNLALRRRDQDGWNLILWDIEQKKQRQVLKSDADFDFAERGVAFAPDSKRLLVIGGEESLHLWDTATGEKLSQKRIRRGGRKAFGKAYYPMFSPDGRLLAATIWQPKDIHSRELKGLSLIEASSGEEVIHLENSALQCVAFTPDSCGMIVTDSKSLCVWDTSTGERLHQIAWPERIRNVGGKVKVRYLAVLPNGKAITVMSEGDILVWNLATAGRTVYPPIEDLGHEELDALWADLAADARLAYRAVQRLTTAPFQAVSFLSNHLLPTPEDAKRAEKLLADLDSDSFTARETASRELVRMGGRIEVILRRALQSRPSLEARRRIKAVLAERKRPSTEDLRILRAIAVLERIGTPEAKRILEKLGSGAAARETHEAQVSLQRLNHR